MNNEDTVRVLRVLEYVGPRSRVEDTLSRGLKKGSTRYGDMEIRSAIIGDFPEILTDPVHVGDDALSDGDDHEDYEGLLDLEED